MKGPRPDEAPLSGVDATVIVPVRNEADVIRETARSITAQRFEGTLEFLFVDGRSDDGTRAILEELAAGDPRMRVLDNPERQIGTAFNIGLRAARGEYVAKMDAHTHFPPDYLALAVERLRRNDVGWVTGPAIPEGTGKWSRRVALALSSPLGVGGSGKWTPGDRPGDGEWELDTGVFSGVWRRDLLERLGGWDEGWPVNGDSELAARHLAEGGRIVCIAAMGARYLPRDSLEGLARQYWRYGFYRAKTGRRHPRSMRPSHLLCPALLLSIPAAAAGARTARLGLAAYGTALVTGALRLRPSSGEETAGLAAVFATMHLAWGAGFLAGCARFGPPVAGIASALARAVRRG